MKRYKTIPKQRKPVFTDFWIQLSDTWEQPYAANRVRKLK